MQHCLPFRWGQLEPLPYGCSKTFQGFYSAIDTSINIVWWPSMCYRDSGSFFLSAIVHSLVSGCWPHYPARHTIPRRWQPFQPEALLSRTRSWRKHELGRAQYAICLIRQDRANRSDIKIPLEAGNFCISICSRYVLRADCYDFRRNYSIYKHSQHLSVVTCEGLVATTTSNLDSTA